MLISTNAFVRLLNIQFHSESAVDLRTLPPLGCVIRLWRHNVQWRLRWCRRLRRKSRRKAVRGRRLQWPRHLREPGLHAFVSRRQASPHSAGSDVVDAAVRVANRRISVQWYDQLQATAYRYSGATWRIQWKRNSVRWLCDGYQLRTRFYDDAFRLNYCDITLYVTRLYVNLYLFIILLVDLFIIVHLSSVIALTGHHVSACIGPIGQAYLIHELRRHTTSNWCSMIRLVIFLYFHCTGNHNNKSTWVKNLSRKMWLCWVLRRN